MSGWFSADPALLRDHPFSFPLVGLGQLWSFGDSSGRGAWSWLHWQGSRACIPPVLLGLHTQFPTSALPLPGLQGREQASPAVGSLACVPVGVLVPTSLTVTVLCALGCCAAQWVPVRREGDAV